MQYSQEHLKTMVYAEFGGQTECIMGNWKIENETKWSSLLPGPALLFFIFRYGYLISRPKSYRDFRETGPSPQLACYLNSTARIAGVRIPYATLNSFRLSFRNCKSSVRGL